MGRDAHVGGAEEGFEPSKTKRATVAAGILFWGGCSAEEIVEDLMHLKGILDEEA